ncbi:MAG TPA: hypothetical protein VFL61_04830 [Gaiellaceae bacterium]|nr:hypothetical protein [Gaiellaceae bacterium]
MTRDGWTGWIAFAAFMLLLVGAVDMIQGVFAIIEDDYIVGTPEGLAIIDVTGWGWLNLVWGGLLFLAGLALLGGAGWARWLAIIGVSVGAVAQMGFLANYPQAYPLWNVAVLALQIIVLYALIARWEPYKESVV